VSHVADTKRIRFDRHSPARWRVTFDHPPLNTFGPESIPELNEIITVLETDEHVKVVVFDSAVEGFFLTDAQLDSFVDALAERIASFDKQAIAETKRLVDLASLPSDAEIAPEWEAFIAAVERPAGKTRLKTLIDWGLHTPGDVENRLGYYVGRLGS
jgi:enoyl-CoA hydratase/carnithine racemase